MIARDHFIRPNASLFIKPENDTLNCNCLWENILTHEELTKERNIFIVFFILAFVLSALFNHLRMNSILKIDEHFQASDFHGYSVILTFLKVVFIYFVYRLSRFLKVSTGLTVFYCMLALITLAQIIPFTLLLAKVKSTRVSINTPSESLKHDLNSSGWRENSSGVQRM